MLRISAFRKKIALHS